jgi:hypothetical protein
MMLGCDTPLMVLFISAVRIDVDDLNKRELVRELQVNSVSRTPSSDIIEVERCVIPSLLLGVV